MTKVKAHALTTIGISAYMAALFLPYKLLAGVGVALCVIGLYLLIYNVLRGLD